MGWASFTAEVDGDVVLNRSFNRINEYISDFRSVWPSVADEFYKIINEQFASEGSHGASGKWAPLTPAYKKWKTVHFPGDPTLKATHSLFDSMTNPDAADAIFKPEKDQLTIGSKVPYAVAHQRGGGSLPARPIISLTEDDQRRLQKAIQLPLVQFARRQGFIVDERAA